MRSPAIVEPGGTTGGRGAVIVPIDEDAPRRRDVLRRAVALAVTAPLTLAGCRRGKTTDDLPGRIDRACRAAATALVAAQSADGSWRSPTYGIFRDGLTLTPTVLKAVSFGPDVPGAVAAARRGAAYLAGRVRADGSIDDGPTGLVYPVYTAAATLMALSRRDVPGADRARAAWLGEIRRRQLAGPLGWTPDDPAYGGWGYAIEPATKADADAPGARPPDADLSSTLFAVGALRVSGAGADDPAIARALRFVDRCQNLAEDGTGRAPAPGGAEFDDGGFFFSPTDPVRNKAGAAGTDRAGRPRFRSYGSATADGIRALLRCGLATGHPRVGSARGWIERHFSAATNPGRFAPIREVERDATYYYYAWSLAHAFRALADGSGRDAGRAAALASELLRRQRPDGTWANPSTASKEDDPLVATSFAAGALGLCRLALAR